MMSDAASKRNDFFKVIPLYLSTRRCISWHFVRQRSRCCATTKTRIANNVSVRVSLHNCARDIESKPIGRRQTVVTLDSSRSGEDPFNRLPKRNVRQLPPWPPSWIFLKQTSAATSLKSPLPPSPASPSPSPSSSSSSHLSQASRLPLATSSPTG